MRFKSNPHMRRAKWRPNKNARGMTYTADLRGHHKSDALHMNDADYLTFCRLVAHGTTDTLRGLYGRVERVACPCCRQKAGGKVRLNNAGRARLAMMRRRRDQGLGKPCGLLPE